MSSASTTRPQPERTPDRYRLSVNSYDRTASLLVALLTMATTVFIALLVVFLFRTFSPVILAKPVEIVEPGSGGEPPKGFANDPEPPGIEDAPDLNEPVLEDTLSAISDTMADQLAGLSDQVLEASSTPSKGSGQGDVRNSGTGTGGTGGGTGTGNDCPKELKYEPSSQADYERMLDYFQAELAVLDPRSNKVYYAKNLQAATPTTRVGEPPDKRFNFRSTGDPLRSMEIQIARKAGIMKSGAIIVVFYPDEIKNQIYGIERERMNENNVTDRTRVRKTIFRFFRVGDAYDFKVEDQTYY